MSDVQFGLTMNKAWKEFFLGRDYYIYRDFETKDSSVGDLKDKFYKYNYRLFVLLILVGFFFSISFKILLFSLLWYKPLCHAFHLRNRVNRFNINEFKKLKGLE